MLWHQLSERVLQGKQISREEALHVLAVPQEELLELISACYRVRRHYHGQKIKLNMLINAKSGLCAEDCSYCSQSIVSQTGVERYPLQSREVLLEGARQALEVKAHTYCIVISGRRPTERELKAVTEAVREIKEKFPLRICCCLGLLNDEEVKRLRDAGVDRINHNLNTSEDRYGDVCSTHTFQDRTETIEAVKRGGISSCSGGILGMGESDEQIVDLVFSLRDMDIDSIPVNFLIPIPGTPLAGIEYLTPQKCLAILCLFRLVNPSKEIRIAGGREFHLRSLQPLGLYVADSIFIGDYLTTRGEVPEADMQMLQDTGFVPSLPPGWEAKSREPEPLPEQPVSLASATESRDR
ncbi:MAG: biotin synthase BioB [Acidobacteria bacterium]|nr:biotin synthase BioB [Acidobacteriota bacterium]MCZ6750622.1 biotin synthase BioB [Acidobacteriota bacterium]